MPLRGEGVLAIWNGIADGKDAAFREWHIREHIPERIGVPGFLRGRRYQAVAGHPAYFNFYEVERPETLASEAYLARLDDPSPWTQATVRHFTDTSRTVCRVRHSAGIGIGAYVVALRFDETAGAVDLAALLERPEVIAAHLLVRTDPVARETAEMRLRSGPDTSSAMILLAEFADEAAARQTLADDLSDPACARLNLAAPVARGLYRLEYALDKADLIQHRET